MIRGKTMKLKKILEQSYWKYSNTTNTGSVNKSTSSTSNNTETPDHKYAYEKEIDSNGNIKYKSFTIAIEVLQDEASGFAYIKVYTPKGAQRSKPIFSATKNIDYYVKKIKKNIDFIIAKKLEKAQKNAKIAAINLKDKLTVGDIFYTSWGYEQTNVDFYEVTGFLNKLVLVREISQRKKETGFMSGSTIPVPGKFISGQLKAKPIFNNDETVHGITIYGVPSSANYAARWDGQPVFWSSYA